LLQKNFTLCGFEPMKVIKITIFYWCQVYFIVRLNNLNVDL
jgi:hypothetical protein